MCHMAMCISFGHFMVIYYQALMCLKRGAVVEWLEQLGYGAESRRIA